MLQATHPQGCHELATLNLLSVTTVIQYGHLNQSFENDTYLKAPWAILRSCARNLSSLTSHHIASWLADTGEQDHSRSSSGGQNLNTHLLNRIKSYNVLQIPTILSWQTVLSPYKVVNGQLCQCLASTVFEGNWHEANSHLLIFI